MDPIKIRVLSNNLYICKNKPKMDYLLKRSLWVAGLATFFLIQTWYEQWYWTASYDNAINGITFSCGERHDLLFGAGNGKLKYEGLAIRPVYAD